MPQILKDYFYDDTGAVTVDWVVLTAAIVGLAVAVLVSVGGPTAEFADKIGTTVGDYEVATY
ncbi:MAG: hypothetical protein AAFX45_03890 [Pseudomonadota bacterium]